MPFESHHSSPYARLVANVIEDGECWCGTESARSGRTQLYVRVNFRVPGLGGRVVHFTSHVLTWVLSELADMGLPCDNDSLWLAYWEFRCSGLEIDHTCNQPACRRPKHLEPVTRLEQEQRKWERRRALFDAMPDEETEPAW